MSNSQRKGNQNSSGLYESRGRREINKSKRIARDAARKKPLPCGHGSRHARHFWYGDVSVCIKCIREGKPRIEAEVNALSLDLSRVG